MTRRSSTASAPPTPPNFTSWNASAWWTAARLSTFPGQPTIRASPISPGVQEGPDIGQMAAWTRIRARRTTTTNSISAWIRCRTPPNRTSEPRGRLASALRLTAECDDERVNRLASVVVLVHVAFQPDDRITGVAGKPCDVFGMVDITAAFRESAERRGREIPFVGIVRKQREGEQSAGAQAFRCGPKNRFEIAEVDEGGRADDDIVAGGMGGKELHEVALMQSVVNARLPRLVEHGRRKIDAIEPARNVAQFQAHQPRAAARIENVESRAAAGQPLDGCGRLFVSAIEAGIAPASGALRIETKQMRIRRALRQRTFVQS